MLAEYNKQSKKCFNDLYGSSSQSKKCVNKNTQRYRYQEIVVKMPPPVSSSIYAPDNTAIMNTYAGASSELSPNEERGKINDITTEQINHCSAENHENTFAHTSENQNNEKEVLYGRGLFHYGKWWERSEVDIFVNGNILTGIPIFTDKNTLRVVNNCHSYFVPMEKVDYIRTTDGLQSCSDADTIQ